MAARTETGISARSTEPTVSSMSATQPRASRSTAATTKTPAVTTKKNAVEKTPCKGELKAYVTECMAQYFGTLNGHQPTNLYDMVIEEIEAPLLSAALEYCEGNQSRTAEVLGLNRGTLRKKLRAHNLSS